MAHAGAAPLGVRWLWRIEDDMKRSELRRKSPMNRGKGFTRRKGSKFGNEHTFCVILKRYFDSKAEAAYGLQLFARQENGEIENLEFQVKVEYVINGVKLGITYRCDFRYRELRAFGGRHVDRIIYDEFKGMAMPVWKLKLQLWKAGAGPQAVLRVTRSVHNKIQPYQWTDHYPAGMEVDHG